MLAKKPQADLIKKCEELESKLHMVNIVQIRQTVEVEVKRLGQLQQNEDKGWISWMFGSKKKSNAADDESDISKRWPLKLPEMFTFISFQRVNLRLQ